MMYFIFISQMLPDVTSKQCSATVPQMHSHWSSLQRQLSILGQSFTIKALESWKVLAVYCNDKLYECYIGRVMEIQWWRLTSWRLAVNTSHCSLFWVAPAIFTFQKTDPHSCSQAAVTLGLLLSYAVCCMCVSQWLWEEALCWGL